MTRTRFALTNREVMNVVVKPDITAMDLIVRVRAIYKYLSTIILFDHVVVLSFTEETPCSRVRCSSNSQCVENDQGHPECRCLPGYQETESQCQLISSPTVDCRQQDKCDINAQCVYNSQTDRHQCQCLSGFRGDGLTCTRSSGN